MKRFQLVVLSPLLIALAGACGSAPPPPTQGGPYKGSRVAGEAPEMNSVVMLDASVANAISVERTDARAQPTGGIEARAVLLNRAGEGAIVRARAVFYDQGGMPIDDETAFQNVDIPARGQKGIKFNSTSLEAAKYVIEIGEIR